MPGKRVALVTGANKGIGLAIARALGAEGFQVWVGARDPERGERAAGDLRAEGHDARFLALDVADDESVAAAAARLGAEVAALDVLVNNAGIVRDVAPPSLALVTDPSSIYATANLLGSNSSKTALNAIAVAFSKELAPLGIKVNAVEPGVVATDLNGHQGHSTPEQGAASAVRMALIGHDGPTGGFFGLEGRTPW